MNINYKQPQFELFPANSAALEDVNKPRFLLANLTLSIESLVILTILVIMVGLFSFSIGVERGKHLTAQVLDERVAAVWNVGRKSLPAVSKPAAMVTVPLALQKPMANAQGNAGNVNAKNAALKASAMRAALAAKEAQMQASLPVSKSIPVGGNWTVQIGTFRNATFAQQEAQMLKAKGLQPFMMKKGDFWLVCIGKFTSMDGASAFLKKLPAKYRVSQIRRF